MNHTKPKATWITAFDLRKITGWDNNKMSKARRLDWVKYKKSDTGGYLYQLESIPQQLQNS